MLERSAAEAVACKSAAVYIFMYSLDGVSGAVLFTDSSLHSFFTATSARFLQRNSV